MTKRFLYVTASLLLVCALCFTGCDMISDSSLIGELLNNANGDDNQQHSEQLDDIFPGQNYVPGGSVDEYVSYDPDYIPPENGGSQSACDQHSFGEWTISVKGDCIREGEHYHSCTVCGYSEFEPIAATGHHYVTEQGVMICQNCNREYYSKGLLYTKDDAGYIVTGIGECTDIEVNVPETYQGEIVHTIGRDAFNGCGQIQIIGLHDGIQTIESSAFGNCTSLETLSIPSTLTSIDDGALFLCYNLQDIIIKQDNPNYTFRDGCLIEIQTQTLLHGVEGFVIPDDGTVTKIASDAFAGLQGLSELVIPEGVTEIGASAFYCVGSLERITFPSTLQSIGYNCFNACGLVEVVIPEGITKLEDNSFNFCTELTTVYIPASVESIGIYAFHNCTSLERIVFGGTQEQWNSMVRTFDWDLEAGDYTVEFAQ